MEDWQTYSRHHIDIEQRKQDNRSVGEPERDRERKYTLKQKFVLNDYAHKPVRRLQLLAFQEVL